MCTILDLYTTVSSTWKEVDEAVGLPALSVAPACSMKYSISSLEDEASLDGTPLGKEAGVEPNRNLLVEFKLPVGLMASGSGQCCGIHALSTRMSRFSVDSTHTLTFSKKVR